MRFISLRHRYSQLMLLILSLHYAAYIMIMVNNTGVHLKSSNRNETARKSGILII